MSDKSKGMLLMLISSFSFTCMQGVVKVTGEEIGVMQQVFFRNLISLIIVSFIIKKEKLSFFGEKKYQPQLFARSVFGFIGVILLFYATRNAYQADVTVISRLSPFLITLLSVIFLKEKISKPQVLALFIAFAGAFLAAQPRFESDFSPMAAALLCSVFSAVAYTLLAYFKNKVNALTVIMHFSTFSTIASIPFMLGEFTIPGIKDLFILLLIGVFAAIGQITLTYSYRFAPASEVSIYSQSAIIFAFIMGFLFFNEMPAGLTIIGGVLIMAASLLVYFFNRKWVAV